MTPRTILGLALLAGGLTAVVGCSSKTSGPGGTSSLGTTTRVNAGGATFPDPLVQKWAAEYRKSKGVEIDYIKKGSGYGIAQVTAKNFDFGCSDAPMNKKEVEKAAAEGGEVVHVPVTMGAVAVVYNLPELKEPLKLSGPVLADIFRRKVTKWNGPAIAALNPGAALPDQEIAPVVRAEDSGTTNIYTEYLSKVSPEFKAEIGVSKKPKWPPGTIGQEGSDGVTGHVQKNPYCIGYVEVLYAKKNKVPFALLKNKKGQFAAPDPDSVTAAAAIAMTGTPAEEPYSLHALTYSLTDADGEKAYPIAGVSYAILYKKQPKDKGPVVVEFLKWAVTEGQAFAPALEYAPLPGPLSEKAKARLDQVTFE